MAVQDVSPQTEKALYVYNSDSGVADSGAFAGRYCNEYGIPAANRVALALGTANILPYSASHFSGWMTTLYNAVQTTGASCIIVGAGCPASIGLLTADGTAAGANEGGAFDFVHLCGAIKEIVGTLGYAPRVVADGLSGYFLRKQYGGGWDVAAPYSQDLFPAFTLGAPAAQFPSAIETYANADYAAAVASWPDAGDFNSWVRYKAGFRYDYSAFSYLPCGWAGWYSFEETTHPADLLSKSIAVLNRAISASGKRVNLLSRKVLLGLGGYSGATDSLDRPARFAVVGKRFIDLGFDVEYWSADASDNAANALVPWAGAKAGWNAAALDAGTAPGSVSYDVAFGPAFANGAEYGGAGPVWHGAADNIRTTANGLFIGGKSGNGRWGKANQVQGGHSSLIMQNEVGGQHAGITNALAMYCDVTLELLNGRSLIEAAFLAHRGTLYAIGDPLHRPFAV